LSSVAVVRTGVLEDPPVAPHLDRRIDVGGPTGPVATGRVDPGDGMAPVALVGHREDNELAALRLYRPGAREDRYALMGRTEVPAPAEVLYVPDQLREGGPEPTVCCPGLDNEDDASLGWANMVTAD